MHRFPAAVVTVLFLLAMLPAQGAGAAVTAPKAVINIPGIGFNSTAGSAGVDFIDYFAGTKMIYLTDRQNKGVDIIDPASNTLAGRIPMADGPRQFFLDSSINMGAATLSTTTMGIINFNTNTYQSVRIGAPTDLGGYDPVNHIVAAASSAVAATATSEAIPPMVSFVQLDPTTGGTLLSQLPFTARPEASPYDSANGMFLALEATDIALIDPVTQTVTDKWELPGCTPHNIAWGPNNEGLVGCTTGEVVLNAATGAIVARIDGAQVGGSDQVAYNPTSQTYVAAGSVMRSGMKQPVLAWIDAIGHQVTKVIDIDSGSFNQVAVDPVSGMAYVATQPAIGGACTSACVFVYAPTS